MPTKPFETAFVTSASLDNTRSQVLSVLAARNGLIQVDRANDISARLGSGVKTRFWGGMLVDKKTLPRSLTVSLAPISEGTRVAITVKDTLGFGLRIGLVGKYRQAMLDDAVSIKNRLQDAR